VFEWDFDECSSVGKFQMRTSFLNFASKFSYGRHRGLISNIIRFINRFSGTTQGEYKKFTPTFVFDESVDSHHEVTLFI